MIKGYWDWCRLRLMFQEDILENIIVIHPPRKDTGRYVSIWGRSNNGIFTTKTAYEALTNEDCNNQKNKWKKIWDLKRYLSGPFCNDCKGKEETISHALRDCNSIRHVWLNLVEKSKHAAFFNSNLPKWLALNMNNNLSRIHDMQ
ncbi:hypothetical protein KIW84_072823 [Lathyrus oleraceus]|uniref:Reverse transcriptase zinc-binding domain-containing protein n=1 Tax=Pisum sativum TaxID=3888 RepID=A0A9D4ZY14_PEA|nr:hypothetical protein KIW84_072823 [Pisum sativum]